MIQEWPCTCLPAPFDEPCEGCKKNAAPTADVVVHQLTLSDDERAFIETRQRSRDEIARVSAPMTWSGIDMASGPDMSVRAEFDADGNLLRIPRD
jgi:hypothetical protein